MNERLKKLRKYFNLTQKKFAEKIGVKQNTVAQYEMGRNIPIDSVITLICKEFNVNEDWLRNGTGSMFIEHDDFDLNEFVNKHNITDLELDIIKTYLQLDPNIRHTVIESFKNTLTNKNIEKENVNDISPYDSVPATAEELERLYPPIDINARKKKAGE